MHDPWTDRLSEYLDGELDADQAARLEAHLASCDDCAATITGLRDVVAAARALQDREPASDLWAGIAARMQEPAPAAAGTFHGDVATDDDVVSIDAHRGRRARSFSFTMPQLAAAALVLMSLSAGAVWLVTGGESANGEDTYVANGEAVEGTIFQSVAAQPSDVQFVDTRPVQDDEAARSLAALLDEARESLDPATVEVLERSIASIEDAIASAQEALEADPGNPRLQRQLDTSLQRREDLAMRVNRVQRGGA